MTSAFAFAVYLSSCLLQSRCLRNSVRAYAVTETPRKKQIPVVSKPLSKEVFHLLCSFATYLALSTSTRFEISFGLFLGLGIHRPTVFFKSPECCCRAFSHTATFSSLWFLLAHDSINVFIMRLYFLLFLTPVLKIIAKPLQTASILAPRNYGSSELNLDHTESGQNPPGLVSPIPLQYIQASDQIPSAPRLDPGPIVTAEISLNIGPQQDTSSLPISTSLYTTSPEGFEMAAWPYEPYCPVEDAFCCTGEYAPETMKFLDGCSPCI